MKYQEAEMKFASARSKHAGKPLALNTRLLRVDDKTFAVRLYGTDVVLIHADGTYTLQAKGFRSYTTKDRINKYSPARVSQKNWEWSVGGFHFFDGVKVNGAGEVLNADPALAVR